MYEIFEGTKSAHEEDGLTWYELDMNSPKDVIVNLNHVKVNKKSFTQKIIKFCVVISLKSGKDFSMYNIFAPICVPLLFSLVYLLICLLIPNSLNLSLLGIIFLYLFTGNVIYEILRVVIPMIFKMRKIKHARN